MDIIKTLMIIACLSTPALISAQTININTADQAMLMEISGVGERLSDAIISYREENGPFKSVDELANVHGIGPVLINKNKDRLVVKEDSKGE